MNIEKIREICSIKVDLLEDRVKCYGYCVNWNPSQPGIIELYCRKRKNIVRTCISCVALDNAFALGFTMRTICLRGDIESGFYIVVTLTLHEFFKKSKEADLNQIKLKDMKSE